MASVRTAEEPALFVRDGGESARGRVGRRARRSCGSSVANGAAVSGSTLSSSAATSASARKQTSSRLCRWRPHPDEREPWQPSRPAASAAQDLRFLRGELLVAEHAALVKVG